MTTRDIKIKVTGVQSVAGADDEPEVLELETRGTYSEKNGNRYIKYDEFIEDVEEPVKNLLRFDEHALQLTKRGSVNTDDLKKTKEFIDTLKTVDKVEVLPYHKLGIQEWERLGIPYKLEGIDPPTEEQQKLAKSILEK